jgi:hypothetical protein
VKRSALKRRTGLRADPEATQAFIQRAREAGLSTDPIKLEEFIRRGRDASARMSRDAVRRTAAKARNQKEGPLSPAEWRERVALASDLRCIVTGTRAADVFDPLYDAHHPLPKGELRARGLHAHVYDARNGVFVQEWVHVAHEFGAGDAARIPREALPAAVWRFCAEMDKLGVGEEWATALVERKHPAAGTGRSRRVRRVTHAD